MKFRKRVKVFPGFHLNFSSTGISSTIGVRGASINFSKKGAYINTGLPGTGVSNRQKIGGTKSPTNSTENSNPPSEQSTIISKPQNLNGEIKSADVDQLTSTSLIELKELLIEAYKDKVELVDEIKKTKKDIKSAKTNYVVACVFLVGLFIKSFKNKIAEKGEYLADLKTQLENNFVNIDVHFDDIYAKQYNEVVNCYGQLLTSEIIWDNTSSIRQDRSITRSAASNLITRTPVKFRFDNIDIIKSTVAAFHFENKNGGDLYIYPAFVIVIPNRNEIAIIDIKDFTLNFSQHRFLEEEKIPTDTKIIGSTWAKVNKNGTPDKRFKGNYEIPIVGYGGFELGSKSGLNESYSFSNYEKAEEFAKAFATYQRSLL